MVRLTESPDMTLDVYRGRKTKMQQVQTSISYVTILLALLRDVLQCTVQILIRMIYQDIHKIKR